MEHPDPPKIEFPCDYPVKVLGRSHDEFEDRIVEVIERHAPGFPRDSLSLRLSGKGTFSALTVTIVATGPEQLDALHRDLMDTGLVNMVI